MVKHMENGLYFKTCQRKDMVCLNLMGMLCMVHYYLQLGTLRRILQSHMNSDMLLFCKVCA